MNMCTVCFVNGVLTDNLVIIHVYGLSIERGGNV